MERSKEVLFIEYLEGYKNLIAKAARIYCREPEERKDLIQDIIVQLWRSFENYDPTYAVSTWTYRIALNVSISWLRRSTTRQKTHSGYHQEAHWLTVEDTAIDKNLEHLYHFIDLLKPIDKGIILLHLEGCAAKEIAEVMGMTSTNVSTKKQRIVEQLKSHFKNINE